MNQGTIGGYWPLYEDGSPVRIGDTVQGTFDPMTVESVEVYATTTTVIGDCDHLHLSPGERVRRVGDAPEGVPCLCRDPDGGVGTAHVTRDNRNWHLIIDGVRYGVSTPARRVIAEALDLTTSRQTLPPGIEWPVVDGEPVVPGDVLWDAETVRRIRVDRVGFDRDGTVLVAGDGEEIRAAGIDGIAYPAGAVSLDGLTRTEPEPEPVLDRDGVPIEVGDTVYRDDGSAHTVNRLLRGKRFNVRTFSETGNVYEIRDEDLTHRRPESWERLAEDALKEFQDYWSCRDIECGDCPSKVDGEYPYQRYDTDGCKSAVAADIVARAKALSGVTDDE